MIRKVKVGYRAVAESGRNMGTFKTKEQAEKRLRQIEMFKHMKKTTGPEGLWPGEEVIRIEMKQKSFIKVVGLIFAVIAVLHLARLVLGWSAVLGTFAVPTWASWVTVVVTGYLAYNAFRLSK